MFDLSLELPRSYGKHRAGWSYALDCLRGLHAASGVRMISFAEKKFVFGSDPGDAKNGYEELTAPWVGVVHCPVVTPSWFNPELSPADYFGLDHVRRALAHCIGLYALSTPLAQWLRGHFDGPVEVLLHPTEMVDRVFDPQAWCRAPARRVVQLGYWLRRLNAIWALDLPAHFEKALVGVSQQRQKAMLRLERTILGLQCDDADVTWYGMLSNEAYDELLAGSIVFIDFYDTSANNAIIECIARGIPVVCPPHRAIIDYLGEGYPLYFSSYEQAAEMCASDAAIVQAHQYLMESGVRAGVGADRFVADVEASRIFGLTR